jgi:hypothetical protein
MLHELDKKLEKRVLRYVRYADDFSTYTKSHWEARKIGNRIYLFLHEKLKLPINREKSGIRKPVQFELLHLVPMHLEKKPERKRQNLILLGVDPDHAYAWSRTRMGDWAVAQSPILLTTVTLKRLAKRGYQLHAGLLSESFPIS